MIKSISLSFLFAVLVSITHSQSAPEKISLSSNWQFRQADSGTWLKATVPGCVHTDLLDNKIIEDPFFGTNEKKLQWIDKKDWEYETVFLLDKATLAKQQLDLVFEGLDTYAEVRLNGQLVLSADNMFRSWRVDCKKWLKERNTLNIRFLSPIRIGLQKLEANGYALPNDNDDSRTGGLGDQKVSVFTRKAQFQYGWDWGPRFVTSGIWKPAYLEAWDEVRIADLHILNREISKQTAVLTADLEIEGSSGMPATLLISVGEKELARETVNLRTGIQKYPIRFSIQNPRLWWSNGIGEQYRYPIKAEILTGNNRDSKELRYGIRTVKLIQDPDSAGKSFYFELNGMPVFAKGANYIPSDIFLNRVTTADYERIVGDAAAAHMNMLRVWGGGFYENELFYDLCDKYGILIWQDFMFACSLYPGDSAFMENVRLEAVDNVKRLRNHPCMALWCGNNECEAAWKDWGYDKKFAARDPRLAEKVWGDYCKLFHRLLYGVVQEYQPELAYWASSPMASWTPGKDDDEVAKVTRNSGDRHYWDVWHGRKPFSKYAELIPRFMSEYGLQSFPGFSTVKTYAPEPADWNIESEKMMHHQKNGRGNMLIRQYMQDWYQVPSNFEHFLYVSHLLQAEGIKVGMEAHRRNMPYCMGSLYWQLNDCWPVASWSGMDYFHRWKALHYYAEKAYNTELVSPWVENNELKLFVVSDRLSGFNAAIEMKILDFGGKLLWEKKLSVKVPANSSRKYFTGKLDELLKGIDRKNAVFIVNLVENGKILSENSWYFLPFKDLALPEPTIEYTSEKVPGGYLLNLRTNKLAKNVFLETEGSGGRFSDNYFDLFPGIPKQIRVISDVELPSFRKTLKILSLYQTLDQ